MSSHRIMVAHEAPLSILEHVSRLTDYDYALVHLFEKYDSYYKFFEKQLVRGREVILDNSIFELGKAFDSDKFAGWVLKLKPTYYIVPDVLENGYETMKSFDAFCKLYPDLPGLKIGVVQGKTYQELVDCYEYMSEFADYIAISFDYRYYLDTGLGRTDLERFTNGRQSFIADLIADGIWNWKKPHHLLGNSLPQEIGWYHKVEVFNIRTVDTSNPVTAGLIGLRYAGDLGLKVKPKKKLIEHFEEIPTDSQMEDINYNIESYRNIVCPY